MNQVTKECINKALTDKWENLNVIEKNILRYERILSEEKGVREKVIKEIAALEADLKS